MGAGADVPEAVDRRAVTGARGERPPEEVLVERERARVRVAVMQVDVRRVEVGRAQHDALADCGLEVRHMLRDPGLDPVGVALAERLGPDAVALLEHARRVALPAPWALLELDP